MKLNIHILYDELKNDGYEIIADANATSLDISGIRLYSNEVPLQDEYIYLIQAGALRQIDISGEIKHLICLGDAKIEVLQHYSSEILYLAENVDIYRELEKVLHIFEKYAEWEQEYLLSAMQRQPLQKTYDIGVKMLVNPVSFQDMSMTMIMYSGYLPDNIDHSIWNDIIHTRYATPQNITKKNRDRLFFLIHNNREPFYFDISSYSDTKLIHAAVFKNSRPFGYLTMTDINFDITPGQISLLAYFRDILEHALTNEYVLDHFSETDNYFTVKILDGIYVEPHIIKRHLSLMGWSESDVCHMCTFRHSSKANIDESLYYHYRSVLSIHFDNPVFFLYDHGITAVIHKESDVNNFLKPSFIKTLKEFDLNVGISMPFVNFMNIKNAYKQSEAALSEGNVLFADKNVYFYADHYADYLIHNLAESVDLSVLCNTRLLELMNTESEKGFEYIHSIRLYIINGQNTSLTAEKLFIHRNTMIYRIKRCEHLLGVTFNKLSENELLSLYFTCLVMEYMHKHE